MTSARGWKSRIRTSNKETIGILKETMQASQHQQKQGQSQQVSTLSSLAIVSKGRHLHRQERKTQPRGPTKQKHIAKEKIGTKTKNRGNVNNTASSTEKTRCMSPEIA
jgi:hypothetical protein